MDTATTNPSLRKKMNSFWSLYRRPCLIIELKDFALSQSYNFPAGFIPCFLEKLRLTLEKIEKVKIEQEEKKALKIKSKAARKKTAKAALEDKEETAAVEDEKKALKTMPKAALQDKEETAAVEKESKAAPKTTPKAALQDEKKGLKQKSKAPRKKTSKAPRKKTSKAARKKTSKAARKKTSKAALQDKEETDAVEEVTSDPDAAKKLAALKKKIFEDNIGEMLMYRMMNTWSSYLRSYYDYLEDYGLTFKEEETMKRDKVPATPSIPKKKDKDEINLAKLIHSLNRLKGCNLD